MAETCMLRSDLLTRVMFEEFDLVENKEGKLNYGLEVHKESFNLKKTMLTLVNKSFLP